MGQIAQARHQPELRQPLHSPSSFSSLLPYSHSPITRFSQPELQGHFTAPVAEKLQHQRSVKHEEQLAKSPFLASPFATQAFTSGYTAGYGYTQAHRPASLRAERNIWRRPMLQQYEVSTRRGHTCKPEALHVKVCSLLWISLECLLLQYLITRSITNSAKFLLQPFHMPTHLILLKWFKHWKFMRDLLRPEYNSSCGTAFVAWQARAVCVAPISPVSADYHGPWVYGSSHMEVVHVHTHAQ